MSTWTRASDGTLTLLIDTHALIWAVQGSPRLSRRAREAMFDDAALLFVSAVIAWEFADLRARGRLPVDASFAEARRALGIEVLPLPEDVWQLADTLPNHHGDPVNRMLIAHAIHADLPLVTADQTIRSYPVRTIW